MIPALTAAPLLECGGLACLPQAGRRFFAGSDATTEGDANKLEDIACV
jgi:hypothetical protein